MAKKKKTYVEPVLYRVDGTRSAMGDCGAPGSGAAGACNNPGADVEGQCFPFGSIASGGCSGPGSAAFTCGPSGTTPG